MKHDFRIEEILAQKQRQRVPGLHDIEIISSLEMTKMHCSIPFTPVGNSVEVGYFSLDSRFKMSLVVYISWAIFLGFQNTQNILVVFGFPPSKCAREHFFQRLMTKRRMRGICCSKVQYLKECIRNVEVASGNLKAKIPQKSPQLLQRILRLGIY